MFKMNWARILLHSIGFSSMIKWPVSLRNFPVSLEAGITWVAKCFGMSMGATASESPQNSITGISICFKALTKRLLCYQTLCDILRNHKADTSIQHFWYSYIPIPATFKPCPIFQIWNCFMSKRHSTIIPG